MLTKILRFLLKIMEIRTSSHSAIHDFRYEPVQSWDGLLVLRQTFKFHLMLGIGVRLNKNKV